MTRDGIPENDADWCWYFMQKLERLQWRFWINDLGQFSVVIGETPDKIPQEVVLAVLGEWAEHALAILRLRTTIH